jgi:hypothetical protein
MTVDQLVDGMSQREFVEWQAYFTVQHERQAASRTDEGGADAW